MKDNEIFNIFEIDLLFFITKIFDPSNFHYQIIDIQCLIYKHLNKDLNKERSFLLLHLIDQFYQI